MQLRRTPRRLRVSLAGVATLALGWLGAANCPALTGDGAPAWVRPEPESAAPPAAAAPELGGLLSMASRLPSTTAGVVLVPAGGVRDLLAVTDHPATGPLLVALPEVARLRASWASLVKHLGWTGPEAADALVGGACSVVVMIDAENPDGAWALLTEVSEATERRLRDRLAALPREIVAGHAVLSIEEGAILLTMSRPEGLAPGRPVRLVATPSARGGEARLASLVPALTGRGPAVLGKTAAFDRLSRVGPASVAVLFRGVWMGEARPDGPEPEPWDTWVCAALRAPAAAGAPAGGNDSRLASVELALRVPRGHGAPDPADVPLTADSLAGRLPGTALAATLDVPVRVGAGRESGAFVLSSLALPWLRLPGDDALPAPGGVERRIRAAALLPGVPANAADPAAGPGPCAFVALRTGTPGAIGDREVGAALARVEADGDPSRARLSPALERLAGARLPAEAVRSLPVVPVPGSLWARVLGDQGVARWHSRPDEQSWSMELRPRGVPIGPAGAAAVSAELDGLRGGVVVNGLVPVQPWPERRWLGRGHVRPALLAEALRVPLAKGTPPRQLIDSVERLAWDVWVADDGTIEARVTGWLVGPTAPGATGAR